MAKAKKKTAWSYQSGERGKNRVNLFDRGERGLYLEFREPGKNGRPTRRVRVSLGRIDREEAKAKADRLALEFRNSEPAKHVELTLGRLFDIYEDEMTPQKSARTQAHDRRCFEMFRRSFGADRKPSSLSVRELNRFIADRRSGKLAPASVDERRSVGDRIIESDLALLMAVLNWATRASDDRGGFLLDRNPLKGLKVPKNASPTRARLTDLQYKAIRAAAATVGTWAELFVVLAHDTGHRAASIRQLRWSDVDLNGKRIHWRGETDKIGNDHWTPATEEVVALLSREQQSRREIGDAFVFPARRGDRSKAMSGDAVFNVWKRLAIAAGLPKGERYGWHSLRRKFASDLRGTNLKDLKDLGGWKSIHTLLTCYVDIDEDSQRKALTERPVLKNAVANS